VIMYERTALMKEECPPLVFQIAKQSRCGRIDNCVYFACVRGRGRVCEEAGTGERARECAYVSAVHADTGSFCLHAAARDLVIHLQCTSGLTVVSYTGAGSRQLELSCTDLLSYTSDRPPPAYTANAGRHALLPPTPAPF
jgi:hypothetical protein